MLRNYLTVALRFFSRQRSFSVINIFGLTIGIACSLLIFLFVEDELSFDKFNIDQEQIIRVGFQGNIQGKLNRTTQTGFPVAAYLKTNMPEVESTLRLAHWKTFPVSYESITHTEKYLLLADPDFFRFFSFKLLQGNPDSVLVGDRKVVITESAAKKYFNYKGDGDHTPIGKTITLAQGYTAQISGIAADPPVNSHFHFTLVLSLSSWEQSEPKDWFSGKVITYLKLKENVDPEETEHKIQERLQQKVNQELSILRNTNLDEYKKQGSELTYFFQPLASIHLHSSLQEEIEPNGNIEYIYLFSAIAVFITLLACINFMNLTTAQSSTRAKEVAVRKSVGAQNDRLMGQFLMESYFYVLLALLFSLAILFVMLPPFNYFSGKSLTISNLFSGPFLAGILTFIVITGLVAGSYPAFYLTQFNPIEVMKGNLRQKKRNYGIRNLLVIFQFFISAGLIIATLIVYEQLRFVQQADIGFNKENIVNLLHTKNLLSQGKKFKEALAKNPDIIASSYSNRLPPNVEWQSVFRLDGQSKDFSFSVYEMDRDHLRTMGYQMTAGRFFEFPEDDTTAIIVNETAAKKLGLKNYEEHTLLSIYDRPEGRKRKVIGIIKDFHFQSLKEPIQPLAIIPGFEPNWEMAIRVKGNVDDEIKDIENIFKKMAPDAPFEYSVLQNNFSEKHAGEKRIGWLFLLFTTLAVIIACLGLFGLATFTAEQQRKAIGIRKVLGASNTHIMALLNREFLSLVFMANLLAWPVSWWLMRQWLSKFAYHIDIPLWAFLIATCITFLIAFISVTAKAYRAAMVNPVNSLRTD